MKSPTDYVEAFKAIFRHYIIVVYARKDHYYCYYDNYNYYYSYY